MSESGAYVAAGAIFDYHRIDGTSKPGKTENEGVTEWITATGPINEQIYLMVILCFFSLCSCCVGNFITNIYILVRRY